MQKLPDKMASIPASDMARTGSPAANGSTVAAIKVSGKGVPAALLVSTLPGPGPVTGVVALAISIAGILGKIYSEHWDALAERRFAPVLAWQSADVAAPRSITEIGAAVAGFDVSRSRPSKM